MSNKSSIEWLHKELEDYGTSERLLIDWKTFDELFEQAKEMHKQEIYATYTYAYGCGYRDDGDSRIDYYNKQFGSPNKL